MLHVTNGDIAAAAIRARGPGEVIPWRDVLHEGPVPAVGDAELRAVRARFLAEAGWADAVDAEAGFAERDAALERGGREAEEIVLWFELDLYDQLQLIQILDRLARLGPAGHVSLVLVETLGRVEPAQLRELAATRRPVDREAVGVARQAWAALRAPDPGGLGAIARVANAAIRGLGTALFRHLEQFPWVGDGLALSERLALGAIAAGAQRPLDAFRAAQEREARQFMGDAVFFRYLVELAREPAPLVRLSSPSFKDGFVHGSVGLTGHGERVLERQEDAVRLRGIDRWLGGAYLRGGEAAWRWDPAARALRPSVGG